MAGTLLLRLRSMAAITLVAALVLAATTGASPGPRGTAEAAEELAVPAEPPTVVVTTPPDLTRAPSPIELTAFRDLLLFNADHPAYGRELWRVEADGSGARLVADLWAGTNGADPRDLVVAGDQVFFTAAVPGLGRELWRTDGTAEGTRLVADINPGTSPSRIQGLTAFGDLVVFRAEDGVHGREPWVSDGTEAGTRMLRDINPGSGDSGTTGEFVVVGDQVFFAAFDPTHGSELWVSDGTPAGTRLVTDIRAGTEGSAPAWLTAFGNLVAFRANDGVTGSELWVSDGSAGGTRRVADIREGPLGSGIEEMIAVGGQLFFRANDGVHGRELWASDGSAAYLVKDIIPGFTGSEVNQVTMPQRFTALGDRGVVFLADTQLWVSDGTTAGTTMLAEIRPALAPEENLLITALPDELTSVGGSVLFGADDGVNGRELWITDGTSSGTRLVADLVPGSEGSFPRYFTALGETVFFAALDAARGFELWSWARPAIPEVDDPTATFDGVELTLTFPGPLERPDPLTRTRLKVTADGSAVNVFAWDWSPSDPDLIVLSILGGIDPDAEVLVSYEPRLGDTPIRYTDGVELPPFRDVLATYTRAGWVMASTDQDTLVSLDGRNWQRSLDPAFGEFSTYRALATDGRGTWLAASRSNTGPSLGKASVRRSSDGLTWSEPIAMGIPSQVYAIEPVPGGGWLGVGDQDNMLMSSSDGTSWTVLPDPIAATVSLTSLAHDGAGRWVAVGGKGTILVSDDRASWQQVGIAGEPDFDRPMRAVAHGDGRWIAVADNALLTSSDGRAWSRIAVDSGTLPPSGLRGVLHDGDGRWLLWTFVGLFTSLDGLDWERAVSSRTAFSTAGHHDGQWIVAAADSSRSCVYVSASATPFNFWETRCMRGIGRSIQHGRFGVARAADRGSDYPSLSLAALEVNQVVQDWEGLVPLVALKQTVVRAHFDGTGPPVTVTGQLHGVRDGQPLPGSPLPPINVDAQIEVVGAATDHRQDPARSLNFLLPLTWRAGVVELRLEASSVYGVNCKTPPVVDCAAEAVFVPARTMDLRFVRSGYDIAIEDFLLFQQEPPLVSDLPEQALRLMDQVPTSYVSFISTVTTPYVGEDKPGTQQVLDDVTALRILDGCTRTCSTYYYGVLGGPGGGRGWWPGWSSMGYTNAREARSATGFGRQMIGHEVGHNLGLGHTPMPGPVVTQEDGSDVLLGRCNSTAPEGTPIHPFDEEVRPGVFRPAIGALGDAATEIWGASPRFFGSDDRFAVIDPRETFALMSYCWQGGAQDSWISVDHYLALLEDFTGSGTATTAGSEAVTAGSAVTSADERLLVAGTVDLADGATELRPIWPLVDGAGPEPITAGDHQLRLLGADGTELLDQRFGFAESGPHGDKLGTVRSFLLDLPRPVAPIERLEIRAPDGTVRAALEAGTGPLEVRVTAPTAGTVFDGDEVTITWQYDDPEGTGPVSFVVQHSADDGDTWRSLALGTTETSMVIPRAELAGSPQARFRVLASADLRTAVGVSDRFEIAGNAPVVTIDRPLDGLVVRPTQQVTLVAVAMDAEDGLLRDEQVRWVSDIDGELGTGEEITTAAWGLSLGTHELTAIATDRDGEVGTATITVQVGTPLEPGDPVDDDPGPGDDGGSAPPEDTGGTPPPDGAGGENSGTDGGTGEITRPPGTTPDETADGTGDDGSARPRLEPGRQTPRDQAPPASEAAAFDELAATDESADEPPDPGAVATTDGSTDGAADNDEESGPSDLGEDEAASGTPVTEPGPSPARPWRWVIVALFALALAATGVGVARSRTRSA